MSKEPLAFRAKFDVPAGLSTRSSKTAAGRHVDQVH